MGRPPLIVPGPSSPIPRVRDLSSLWTPPGDILLQSQLLDDLDEVQVQFWIEGQTDRGEVFDFIDPLPVEILEGNSYRTRIRHVVSGEVGPWSKEAKFDAFNSLATRKDVKTSTYLGPGTGITPIDLVGMGLNFAAGDPIFIYGCASSGNQPTTLDPLTDWEVIAAINDLSSGSRRAAFCGWKIATGSETTQSMFTSTSVTNFRVNYIAASFSILGNAVLGASPSSQFSTGTPSAQTIPTSVDGDHRIAVGIAFGTTSTPSLTFAGYSPQFDLPYSQTTTVRVDNRLKIAILPPNAPLQNITVTQNDAGNNILVSFYLVVRPPE